MFSYKTLRLAHLCCDAGRRQRRALLLTSAMVFVAAASGCRYDMQNQPKYIALRESTFFKDGVSARPLEKGTIPRGYLRDDTYFWTGKGNPGGGTGSSNNGGNGVGASSGAAAAGRNGGGQGGSTTNERGDAVSGEAGSTSQSANPSAATQNAGGAAAGVASGAAGETDGTVFPYPVTQAMVERGQERFNIYCSMCHGMTGYGDGMIVRRGYKRPPSYHTDELRAKPVGHYFDVMTNGWGSMPSYAEQIPPQDRWAIAAYIRALQMSQRGAAATSTNNAAVGGGQESRPPTPVRQGQQ